MEQVEPIRQTNQEEIFLPAEELKRITNFFEILIQIDQKERKKLCKK